ncbi:MAG TPA: hypothetical protein VLX90_22430 [Steroidobacteraceae bacterium]|nr:hypothetical protein [Steroidobacteraceae bacterium]
MHPAQEYTDRLAEREALGNVLSRQHERLGGARLAVAALFVPVAWFSLHSHAFGAVWLLLPALAFAALVWRHSQVRRLQNSAARAADFYRAGLARLQDRWPGSGRTGERFADPHHVYEADLDLFGRGSLFELLCQGRTRMGEERLAQWLLSPATAAEIQARQAAIRELAGRLDLREGLAVAGEHADVGVHPAALLEWAESANGLAQPWLAWVRVLGPALALATGLYWAFSGFAAPFLLVVLLELLVLHGLRRPIERVLDGSESAFQDLALFAALLTRLERESAVAPALQALATRLSSHTHPASDAIGRLSTLVSFAGSRRNQFVGLAVIPLLYTLQVALALERWRRRHGAAVRGWVEAVGELEALLSLAAFSHEHPDYPFPQLAGDEACFAGTGLGHPLIPAARRVSNDVELGGPVRILLVSGSNMSGKSTLLRTVGINTVLAMCGAPVCARQLRLSALQVGASIRINDSLHEGSSRFYAEITRLRQLIDLTEGARPLLFLLDELLQGTNSRDRRSGAEGIVRALAARRAVGLISTHDLALTEIAGLDSVLHNVHFEDDLRDGRMIFDYRLRPGVVTRSNALELMRSIGLKV